MNKETSLAPDCSKLLQDIRSLIEDARQAVATTVNVGMTMLYWHIGKRIALDTLGGSRAKYGEKIVSTVSRQLEMEYGRGFSAKNIRHMIRFFEAFPDDRIVSTLSRQLSWSHFKEITYLKQPLQKEFYAEMCRVERWDVRTLRKKIGTMLYERTALSQKPKTLAKLELQKLRKEDKLTPDLIFKDPYFLDFLGLKDRYLERDLEDAIMREMEGFILELGTGFTFVARQKRIQIDNDDYYIDLLFYHRDLKRLIAIDLKMREFQPGDKGQMELYLRWLDKYERKSEEDPPLGLILCSGKKHEQIELLELEKSGIRVASYWIKLLPRKLLEKKLHQAIKSARERLKVQRINADNAVTNAVVSKLATTGSDKKGRKG